MAGKRMTVDQILRNAIKLVENKWTVGALARRANGHETTNLENAARFCVLGSVVVGGGMKKFPCTTGSELSGAMDFSSYPHIEMAWNRVERAAKELFDTDPVGLNDEADSPNNTTVKNKVLRVLKAALYRKY